MEADDDAQLMERVAGGDRAAFAVLFDRHQQSVRRFAYRYVGNRARAEELAQDIFVKLFKSAKAYRATARFKTFLFRVAANHCLNELRRGSQKEQAREELDDTAPSGSGPDQVLEGHELERAVGQALAGMSDRERAAFSMCRFEGMPYRDIAEALSSTESAVKSLIHRATLAVARRVEAHQAGEGPARSRA